ncbi:hypothetical protein SAMN04487848_1023 [Microbacterium sp. ru370.1]|uniref:hypothetical protein n=1 Tax=unclassified Microbacterium TaxID=2609290 RepID=UPI0004EFF0F1|nr:MULTISPECIES: hypothetical protein [unclassified Microbacterium]KEP76411.1 hypothetical protein HR12_00265 [Microbacterium sp. SUBG005]SDO46560.1 hypothetical protein SAMN04487848_1023 [Microbacterium sp. ru370.1]SIT81796.1 hypothetical protein SAMN05880579_1019 [Microbacterium sp. RU1D]
MTDREETQDAPVMDGATEAGVDEKKDGAEEQQAADAAVQDDASQNDIVPGDASKEDLKDDLRSIRGYGEDR